MTQIVQGYRRALYYPSMNIRNPAWLKTALLYWDSIETIVPTHVAQPFKGEVQEACAAAGILKPRRAVEMYEAIEAVGRMLIDADWPKIHRHWHWEHQFGLTAQMKKQSCTWRK
jgi:hypothetical protein